MTDENVLVFPCYLLDRLGRFQGYDTHVNEYINECFRQEVMEFRLREECETNEDYKQVIPYIIVCVKAIPHLGLQDQYFTYTRSKKSGEERLKGLKSLGIGGHVNENDCDGHASFEGFYEGMYRELDEEVSIDQKIGQHLYPIGCINDDSTSVGKVHFGIVFRLELTAPKMEAKDDGMIDAGFKTKDEVVGDISLYENWSQLVIDELLMKDQREEPMFGYKHGMWTPK